MGHLTEDKEKMIIAKAALIREMILRMLIEAGSGHTAGPLDMADIFAAFYFHILNHNPQEPEWPDRDRLILSNGHIVPVRYAAMALSGYFGVEECMTLRKFGTRLQGHPERERLPGVETTAGPLGLGLGQAAGIALAARMDNKKFRTYCLMSDGEQEAGNTWEAAMFAANNKLNNLTAIIDRNNIQINGMTEKVMPLEPLRDKYEAFGWHTLEIDGHNIEEIVDAVENAKAIYEKPTVIIAHTIPGRGIPEIEYDFRYHSYAPGGKTEEEKFLNELRTLSGKISPSDHA